MGSVAEAFHWDSIGPGETVGVFIHPYTHTEFVAFSINVRLASNQPEGAYSSIAAQMTDGPTNLFFGAIARKVFVTNQTVGPQPYIRVGLMRFRQSA
jgi:hypothetical protein